ncbi:hypothetical protein C8F01DRAFT_1329760 [Mycena amicta]|nr:hypothetical protein C8F01DRAFT_1329760 [Mycena amicta]
MASASNLLEVSTECAGFDTDTLDECECDDFQDDGEGDCANCYHTGGFHSTSRRAVDELLAKIPRSKPSKNKGKAKASGSGGHPGGSKSLTSRARFALGSASRESNSGMRPTGNKPPPKSTKNTDNDVFRVFAVAVLPYRTEYDDENNLTVSDEHSLTPTNAKIQDLTVRGLAVTDVISGIEFRKSWTYDQVVEKLSTLRTTGRKTASKGNQGGQGYMVHKLFIVARQAIPADVLKAWVTEDANQFSKPLADGSDEDSGTAGPSTGHSVAKKKNRRRLRSDSDELGPQPRAKRTKETARRWTRSVTPPFLHYDDDDGAIIEGGSDEHVDLTGESYRLTTPEFLTGPSLRIPEASVNYNPPVYPVSPVKEDTTLGNPYDVTKMYNFD